jgi:septum formation protein
MKRPDAPSVILASASRTRQQMLARAGVPAEVEPARIDESGMKAALTAEGASAVHAAETLAELKAAKVSARHRGALVIGADQILEGAGRWFDKPADTAEATAHLRALAGQRHSLATSVCVLRDGAPLWHHNETAYLAMRPLSDAFIADYLAAIGEDALGTLGAYQIEGLGVQLFSRIEGDYFGILGLPLLPLLEFLRANGVLAR